MRGENIVCFAKDWSEDPTSNNHVMRMLAEENKVLWLNSIATRTPKHSHKGDVGKIQRKLKSFFKGPEAVTPGLSVFTPLVLPFPHARAAQVANLGILRGTIETLRLARGMSPFQLWSFIPTAAEYVGRMGEELSVYYCTDEWSSFSYVDKDEITKQEEALCRKVDLVFTTSRGLLEKKKVFNPEAHLASHGVDQAHFAKALDPATPLAKELEGLPHPIIGFFGLVQDWIDTDLLATIAEKRPDWSVVVLGKSLVDLSRLKALKNVRLIDRRPYADLPMYCKGFDVGLCPFRINELTLHVNPIKLREYVSAGLPVVSTDIPECRLAPEWTRIGRTPDEFIAEIAAALASDSPDARRRRSEAMKAETWERKVAALGAHVDRVLQAKRRKSA
jgi:glycosyltransferase involved in cell wall biosynthesis